MLPLIDIVREYGTFGLVAFVATVFLTPLAMRVAHRFGVLDIPDQLLKPHARPIPYLGGAAICVAWMLAALLAIPLHVVQETPALLVIVIGGIGMSLIGLIDDVRQLPPKVRLGTEALIIAAVMLATGTGTRLVGTVLAAAGELFGFPLSVPTAIDVPLSVLAGVFIVLGACNSTNLIDGLDGLCSGVTAIISLGFFLLAAHLAAWGFSDERDPIRLVLSIAMFGAAMGFLPWNFNPARIFMGDAGSVLLGYNCGMLILLFTERPGILRWVLGALMIFALPVFDTMLAMFRRWRAGRSIFEGDRSHFYDQLVQRGFSVRETVLIAYGLTLLYAGLGLLMTWVRGEAGQYPLVIRTRWAVLLYIGVCVLTALVAWWAGLTTPESRRPPRAAPFGPEPRPSGSGFESEPRPSGSGIEESS